MAQEQRDAYIDQNMGGFTKIYPLDISNNPDNQALMDKYNSLIYMEDDLNGKKDKEKEADKDKDRFKK